MSDLMRATTTPTPTRPDKVTIWPVEGGTFGVDAHYTGAVGYRRAEVVHRLLEQAGVPTTFRQEIDGTWAVRLGPVGRDEMLTIVDEVVW